MGPEEGSALITLALFGVAGAIPFVIAATRRRRMTRVAWASVAAGSVGILFLLFTTWSAVILPAELGGMTCFREPMVGLLATADGDPSACMDRSREIVRDRALLAFGVAALQVVAIVLLTRRTPKSALTEQGSPADVAA
jgi:hypothetical protein